MEEDNKSLSLDKEKFNRYIIFKVLFILIFL